MLVSHCIAGTFIALRAASLSLVADSLPWPRSRGRAYTRGSTYDHCGNNPICINMKKTVLLIKLMFSLQKLLSFLLIFLTVPPFLAVLLSLAVIPSLGVLAPVPELALSASVLEVQHESPGRHYVRPLPARAAITAPAHRHIHAHNLPFLPHTTRTPPYFNFNILQFLLVPQRSLP